MMNCILKHTQCPKYRHGYSIVKFLFMLLATLRPRAKPKVLFKLPMASTLRYLSS